MHLPIQRTSPSLDESQGSKPLQRSINFPSEAISYSRPRVFERINILSLQRDQSAGPEQRTHNTGIPKNTAVAGRQRRESRQNNPFEIIGPLQVPTNALIDNMTSILNGYSSSLTEVVKQGLHGPRVSFRSFDNSVDEFDGDIVEAGQKQTDDGLGILLQWVCA